MAKSNEDNIEQLTGKLERIYHNETASGKEYRVFEIIDDTGETQRYSVWDTKLGTDMQEGDAIQYSWKQSGNYRNLVLLERMQEAPPAQEVHHSQSYTDRDRMIGRSVSLKAAVRLLEQVEDLGLEDRIRSAIDIADQFELYLLRGNAMDSGYQDRDDLPF